MVPFEVSIAILNHITDSRLVLPNNCGHWPPFEKPAEWAAHVLAFLRGAERDDSGQNPGSLIGLDRENPFCTAAESDCVTLRYRLSASAASLKKANAFGHQSSLAWARPSAVPPSASTSLVIGWMKLPSVVGM
jgi:hypothetical protein